MHNIQVAFFTESGTSRGMGHLMRSYTICEKFKSLNIKTTFFLDSDMNYGDKFTDINYFKWNNFYLTQEYDIIFIDSYEAEIEIYESIVKNCKVAVYIDDFSRLEYPKGVILNFAPDAREIFFKEEMEKYTYLLGLKYIPIRNDFLKIKKTKKEQIFIMLGGNDVANLSEKLIEILNDVQIKKIVVSNNKLVLEKLRKYNDVEVLFQPSDSVLIQTMSNSKMAISTASMTVYELAYLKVPTMILAVSKNQEQGIDQLLRHKIASDYISIKKNGLEENMKDRIKTLLHQKNYEINNKIDGNGTQYIVDKVMELIQ